jgi:hypothetical protein
VNPSIERAKKWPTTNPGGSIPPKRRTQHRRPDGGLFYEEPGAVCRGPAAARARTVLRA